MKRKLALFVIPLSVVCVQVQADTVPAPDLVTERFKPQPAPLSQPSSNAQTPSQIGAEMPANAAQIRFLLSDIQVEGSSIDWNGRDRAMIEPLLQREVALSEVYEVAEKLTALYSNNGYVLTKVVVPPQRINQGSVRLRVVEGYINEVKFENEELLGDELKSHISSVIQASRPLNIAVLERQLLVNNDLPGLTLKSTLNPSPTEEGASELVVTASPVEISGSLSVDNRGSDSSGPLQAVAILTLPNLVSSGDGLTALVATVPNQTDELKYLNVGYVRALSTEGTRLALDLSRSYSKPGGEEFRSKEVLTQSSAFKFSAIHPLIRSRSSNLSISPSLKISKSSTSDLFSGDLQDNLTVAEFGVVYDRADDLLMGGVNLASLSLSKGLSLFDPSLQTRPAFEPQYDFTSLAVSGRRIQRLNETWSLDFRVSGQATLDRLPSGEQYGLGGERSVRGYQPSEWAGDSGVSASVQLEKRLAIEDFAGEVKLYGFIDAGKVWRNTKTGVTSANDLLPWGKSAMARSAGVGMNIAFNEYVSVNLEWDRPMDRNQDGVKEPSGLYVRASLSF